MRLSIGLIFFIFVNLPNISPSTLTRTKRSFNDFSGLGFSPYNPFQSFPFSGSNLPSQFGLPGLSGFPGPAPFPGPGPAFSPAFPSAFPSAFPQAQFLPPSPSVVPIIICPPAPAQAIPIATANASGLAGFLQTLFARKVAAVTAPHAVAVPVPSPYPVAVKVPVAVPVDRPVPVPVWKSSSHYDHHGHHDHSSHDHHYLNEDHHEHDDHFHHGSDHHSDHDHTLKHGDTDYRNTWQVSKRW